MGQSVWKPILWMLGLLVIFNLIYTYVARQSVDGGAVVSYSRFRAELAAGNIKRITIKGTTIAGDFRNKITVDQPAGDKTVARETAKFSTVKPAIDDPSLMADLQAKNVEVTAVTTETSPIVSGLLYVLPWILIIGVWWLAMRGMRGQGPTSVMGNFSKSGAKMYTPSAKVKVTFDDVAGMENPKMELKEIVDYLRDPKKFQRIGGKVPKGVLLVGPPGTGKTLLARAVAGEADVTFLSISASQFIEMFVGVGAGRVRDLFATAKKSAPSIIFIDELDAVGRSRGAGLGGGHDEREQTLNQLLSEMDGFDSHDEVIVMAATNRPDVLDPALLRPGRFDRHVVIDRPDWRDREKILHVHTRKIPLDKDVDLAVIARGTPGMAGADLENLVNEAAILAARENAATVTMEHMERAKDKVLMGGERKMFITEQEKRITAYHEAGHTIVAKLLPGTDPVHKVTIIPRGQALGVTQQLPEDDRYHYPKSYLMNRLSVALGGRQAERAVFGDLSTGAQNDLKMVNDLAEKMVCQWGMSDKIGAMTFSRGEEHPFLGRKLAEEKTFSEQMAWLIDQEIAAIIKEAEQKADNVIANNRGKLDALVDALMEEETLDGKRIDEVLASVP
ncbi:ATP-dependent zinc metalloprotease FtsH [Geobacter sulfurreducens]|uniref:ATP-dependent zinc metalloprotease FtsH n=1 Tax=Geobacter sulfurreducens (strain ATCC 51573 / DSM 12127 / PCA) TaxID=243231 RepID=Q74DY5_GEOSL|nr:ATP-dependent zinc metalloprotease FtsH [Geobacter sulfurreducens]AAR34556.1 cell division ATP-dependent zinc protease FtsH [Geobacter sulfurreducens PCA]ADI84018.1 cell division ATP-dependent zinc protease FtsH [Geobacter sulfurreducens KN400]AJY70899.1 cell division protein FtsH [Geobacter sulfurreducens]QVW36402.1 ATP-dependent zinc metalloprotease FtsH [Geobacter sulfurreducens]UAC05216.1 ATP-dependent zinc metalloprotease FtsH [Geobacter sulfurreducens]